MEKRAVWQSADGDQSDRIASGVVPVVPVYSSQALVAVAPTTPKPRTI
jgi:hypothetical protein